MTGSDHLSDLRADLEKVFSYETLCRFCYDTVAFKPVYDRLTRDSDQKELINRLVKYADRNGELETLLGWIEREKKNQSSQLSIVLPSPTVGDYHKSGRFTLSSGNIMPQLSTDFSDRLYEILININALQDQDSRNMLLRHLPPGPVSAIRRTPALMTDLNNIITAVEAWGQLDSGEWGLVIVAKNALRMVTGTQLGHELEDLLAEVQA